MEKLIYLYGIIPAGGIDAAPLPSLKGLDEKSQIYRLPFENVEAIVCELDPVEYSEKELEKKTNDVNWLHQKTFHHHETLMKLYERYPIIPMKFCTLYSGLESLKNTINTHQKRMLQLLDNIADKEEWILKLYCERDKIKEIVACNNETIEAKKEKIAAMSPGRQYLEKRRLDQLIDQETEKETHVFSETIHEKLAALSVDHEVKRNWNKDVTGRQEEMCWNSVYMVDKSEITNFKSSIKELQEKWAESGWYFEVTGPWPSYHFARIS
ncbi:GvpL/GvpF family gas vesicle protein [Oceanobacillus profundus]|uniref:GvpL/GvpF family gas vesicle protein n=1 Tax=Oceanobacillus profundus TaxID=372463 RepID=UPI0020414A7B|nr:GvpL/GvpF family gas vesicle protein [Oceanobacillus profundus]MCM3397646.1 GvpL/GvpF family gas vesicle protein [Oceanobacillus profundus]